MFSYKKIIDFSLTDLGKFLMPGYQAKHLSCSELEKYEILIVKRL